MYRSKGVHWSSGSCREVQAKLAEVDSRNAAEVTD